MTKKRSKEDLGSVENSSTPARPTASTSMASTSNGAPKPFPRGKKRTSDQNNEEKAKEKLPQEIEGLSSNKEREEDLFGKNRLAINKKKPKQGALGQASKKQKKEKKSNDENDGLKVVSAEALSYSQLAEDMLLLGRVSAIHEYEVS